MDDHKYRGATYFRGTEGINSWCAHEISQEKWKEPWEHSDTQPLHLIPNSTLNLKQSLDCSGTVGTCGHFSLLSFPSALVPEIL